MKIALLYISLGALLAMAIGALALAFLHGGMPRISLHGWIAMGLGTVLSLAVGGGLMALVFHSARNGHDETGTF